MNIKTVTVIGVTGTMGSNVAGIFASFGNAKVYCVGRDTQKVKKTIPRRRYVVVDFLDFFRNDIYCCDLVVL